MFKIPKNCVIPVIGIGNLETKQLNYEWIPDDVSEWLVKVINEAYEKEGQNEILVE